MSDPRDGTCYWCGGPNGDRPYYHRCSRPICRALEEYWRSARVRWARPSSVYHLACVCEFLRRMVRPRTARDREFAKRFPHVAGRAHG